MPIAVIGRRSASRGIPPVPKRKPHLLAGDLVLLAIGTAYADEP